MAKAAPAAKKKVNKCARGFHRVRHDPKSSLMRCVDCGDHFVKVERDS